jgi:adenine-specific DNA-methyltransferase
MMVSRELLSASGSVFVQISDDNIHHVREVLDEVFGAQNFVSAIAFQKTTSSTSTLISSIYDTILWYAKDISTIKYNPIFMTKVRGQQGATGYTRVLLPNGDVVPAASFEDESGELQLPDGAALIAYDNITSQNPGSRYDVEYNSKIYRPEPGYWKTDQKGMESLLAKNRIVATKNSLAYLRMFSDFPVFPIGNIWQDTLGQNQFGGKKVYVVQTAISAVRRCILMATAPGDLVLDITCGSGTTAYVAEQWGRRWITCDTSRVPLALARQRLLTATFPWYRLKNPSQGPAGGFVYERKQNRKGEEIGGLVARVTLKSIANNDEPETVTLVDRPEINNAITRVCGPFTVEATIQAAMSLEEDGVAPQQAPQLDNPRAFLDRMIEVLRQSKTLQLPGNLSLELAAVRPLADREYLHAEAIAKNGTEKRIAIVFGPEDGAIGSEYVFNASMEAMQQGFQQLFLFGFAIQAKAREMLEKLKIPTTYVTMTPDIVMSDLLKTSKSSEIFSITGLPDIVLEQSGAELHQVSVRGLDIFRPDTMETDTIEAENLPCWMLDTNYNGMAFCASQVFFPKTGAWDNLQKSLKGEFHDSVWEHLAGTSSEPFALGDKRRIAVKVIDERGNELMVVKSAEVSN